MTKLITIKEDPQLKCNKLIKEFLSPDYIYIPYDKTYKINVKNNEEILLNSIVLSNEKQYIYSPISGKVMGINQNIVDGKIMDTIVIENNFREKTKKTKGAKKSISSYTKEEVINLITGFNACRNNLEGNTMVINGIDNEPYEYTMSYLIGEYTEEILDGIDALFNIFNIHKCFFAIKNNDQENVDTLVNFIGTYPNINLKLMPDMYPIGNKEVLIKELVMPSKLDNGVLYFTVEDIYNIYNVLKKNKPITDKLVTFGGDLLNKSKVLKVKIGTNIKDIINEEFKIKEDNYHIVINGLLSGYEINNLNSIITKDIKSVFITKSSNKAEHKCINCGMCTHYCPLNCDPRTGYNMDKCIKCGICNYICPSRIKLVGDKNE